MIRSAATLILALLLITPVWSADNDTYKLAPGDTIEILLYGKPDSLRHQTIDPDGQIDYPGVGNTKAAGLSIPELTRKLKASLSLMIKDPQVCILPVEFKSRRFVIAGAVKEPGSYTLWGEVRILDAIGAAKGFKSFTDENQLNECAADLSHAVLLRNGQYLPVNFNRLVMNGRAQDNLLLTAGDYIYIPESRSNSVCILGEINAPGTLTYREPLTLINALTKAKGFTANADRNSVMLIRGALANPAIQRVDIAPILDGKSPDLILSDKDYIYIPKRWSSDLESLLKLAVNSFINAYALADVTKFFNTIPAPAGTP